MNKMLEGLDCLEFLGNDILKEDIKREAANMESAHLGCFLANSGATGYGGGDMWKPTVQTGAKNPGQEHGCRSPAIPDFNMGSFSLSPIDFEPLPNLFSFGSAYQDFPTYKEKNPHDMADVLLSLKHAVVHPGQVHSMGVPALSPAANFGLYSSQQAAPGPAQVSPTSVSFSVHPPTQVMSPGYAPLSQYGHQYSDTAPTPGQVGGVGPNPANLFPSMSVNVSMNMTMGMAGMAPGCGVMEQMGSPQQPVGWGAGQGPVGWSAVQGPVGGQHAGAAFPQAPLQMSYAASATPGSHPGYGGGYSFTAEIRPTPCPEPSYFDKDYGFKNVAPAASFKPVKATTAGYGFAAKKRPARGFADVNGGVLADGGSKVNLCRICGKTYARPSTLKTHMRTHSGEKPYKCATCNKSFSQAANLTAHIRTHSGEKPFRCPICDRRFSQSSSVTTHMRTHSGERPYRCRMCKKAFSDSSTLTKHLRIHSGEKPYQCKLCLLRFSQSGNLNRHMRVHSNPI